MKNICFKRGVIFALAMVLIASCGKENTEPYYAFDSADYEFIPNNYEEIGTIYRFRNDNNHEIRIQVLYYNFNKEFDNSYGFGQNGGGAGYFYDNLLIEIKLMDFSVDGQIDGFCDRIYIHYFKYSDELYIETEIPTYEAPTCLLDGFNDTSPFDNLSTMEIGATVFNKVKTVETNSYFSLYNDSQIDRLYFDFDHGIIGFDESQNNNQYRLVLE